MTNFDLSTHIRSRERHANDNYWYEDELCEV